MEYKDTYREKDGGWQVILSVKIDGKWRQIKSKQGFLKRKDAWHWAHGKNGNPGVIDEIREKYSGRINREFAGIALRDYKEIYLEAKEIHIEKNTIDSLNKAFKKLDPLMDKLVSEITPMDAQKIVNDMIKSGLKIGTIQLYLTKIKALFNAAIDTYQIIRESPFPRKIELPQTKEKKSVKALSVSDTRKFLDCTKENASRKVYIFALLLEQTGMRVGEAASVCDDDFDFAKGEVRVWRQWKEKKDGTYGFGALKSINSKRSIPLPMKLQKELKSYMSDRKVSDINGRLFDMTALDATKELRKIFALAKIDASPHALRHTYATRLIQQGLDVATVAAIMGDTPDTVINTYVHATADAFEHAKRILKNF